MKGAAMLLYHFYNTGICFLWHRSLRRNHFICITYGGCRLLRNAVYYSKAGEYCKHTCGCMQY